MVVADEELPVSFIIGNYVLGETSYKVESGFSVVSKLVEKMVLSISIDSEVEQEDAVDLCHVRDHTIAKAVA